MVGIAGPNAGEAEYWSTQGLSWIENEVAQDIMLAPATEFLLEASGFAPGMRVLDIGCGTGAHALAVAGRVAPGEVLALDVSEPFLDRVRERAEAAGLPVSTLHGDAQTADLPGGFDIATSRFGVMFFDDPAAAFANIATALKPGGRMVFAAWAPVEVNPWWRVPGRIAAEHLGTPPPTPPNAPGPMGLANMAFATDQLEKAGLDDISVTPRQIVLGHVGGAAGMAALAEKVGPVSRALRLFDATEAQRAAVLEAVKTALAAYEADGEFRLPATLNIIEARVR